MTDKERRQQSIVEILRETGSSLVAELGASLGVTDMTIRRDLESLEEAGAIKRFHGGARLALGSSYEPPLSVREQTNREQKRAVARKAVELIDDGGTVIVDGGSTGLAIADAMLERHLTVCPLSLRVAWSLVRSSTLKVLLPPGTVRPGELSLSGPETTEYLRAHRFDHYLMTASGFSEQSGFTEWNLEDAAVKRTALEVAQNTIAAVDSSKFGQVGFVIVCPLGRPGTIVVDDDLNADQLQSIRANARGVAVAEVEESDK